MAVTWKHTIVWFTLFLGYYFFANGLSGQEIEIYPDAKTDRINSFDLFGFPEFIVESSEQTTPGYYVFEIASCLAIIDHYGNPMFYNEIPGGVRNFEPQPDRQFSYYNIQDRRFYIMNELYQVTDTFEVLNGLFTDFHEFHLFSNGNSILMATDPRQVDMSQVIEGGNPAATVTGMVFQELDADRNLLFQWSSWDHFDILDCDTNLVDLTSQIIDLVHGNSIAIDFDYHFLLSSRHLSEITKINRVTGEIMWRLGGKNNEFTFINDPIGFSGQHSAIRMPYGYLGLFDNGLKRIPQYSRGIKYEINELDKTVSLVEEFRFSPDVYSSLMGSLALMPNNHVLVGWGINSSDAFLTEYDQEGTACTTISIPEFIKGSYRVSFLKQIQSFFSLNKDTLDFGNVEMGDSTILNVEIRNEANYSATLFEFSEESDQFTLLDPLPIQIAEGGIETISLKFKPAGTPVNFIPAYLNFRVDSMFKGEHMVACRLMLQGSSQETSSTGEYQAGQGLNIFPNPFHDLISIENTKDVMSVVIWSMTGEKVFQIQNENQEHLILDQNHLNPGIYFINFLYSDGHNELRKIIKIK